MNSQANPERPELVVKTVRMTAAVVAAAGAIAVGMFAASPLAVGKARGALIAFAIGGGEDPSFIYTIRPDGTGRRRVIGQDSVLFRLGASDPKWSPDGKRLLFGGQYHLDHAAQSLWYSTASGKRITRIPLGFHRSRRRGPRALRLRGWDWAPNGRRVVFAAQTGPAGSRLYTISLDGRHRRALRRGSWPEWSSDGRHIVYMAPGMPPYGPERIAVMRPNGNGFRLLTDSTRDLAPRLSPDGRRVLYVRNPEGLSRPEWRMVDITGTNDGVVATERSSDAPYCFPGWTPDGTRIAVARQVVPERPDRPFATRFVTIDLNGANERRAFTVRLPLCDFSWRPRSG